MSLQYRINANRGKLADFIDIDRQVEMECKEECKEVLEKLSVE